MTLWKPDLSGVEVPAWVKFIAQDSDGSWWGYSVEPLQNHRGWYENELGENIKLIDFGGEFTDVNQDWKRSLFSYSAK